MKMKNLLALLFALVFVLISVLPAFAEEGEFVPAPEQEEETVQPPEETVTVPGPDENPESVSDPEADPIPEPDPDPSEEPPAVPMDPAEGEDVPPASEDEAPQTPGAEENSGEGEDEGFNDPQDPEDGEEVPAEEENPDEEDPEEEEEQESEPDSEEDALIIDVLVPDSGQVIINPYRLKVATSTGESTEQIVHEPQALVNLSGVPVQVDVQAIGMLAGESEAFFVAAPPSEGADEKEIFMYLEFQQFPDQWCGWYGDFDNQLLITSWGESKTNVLTLFPGGEGWYRLSGAMTDFPSVMWEAEDAASVILAFTFNAVPEVPEMQVFPAIPEFSEVPELTELPEFSELPEYWEASDMGI